jgi:nucleoside-diphosphate-sugar epimerase
LIDATSSPSRRVLVLGASGFVGSYAVPMLRAAGYDVVCAKTNRLAIETDAVDIANLDQLQRFVSISRTDVIVHLAGAAHRWHNSPATIFDRVNRVGTENLVQAARCCGVRRLVFLSSASVYGDGYYSGPVAEEAMLHPIGAYALSKARAESACLSGGLDPVIFRAPPIYARNHLLNLRKRAYLPMSRGRLLLRIVGRAQPSYSLCAVENVAYAIVLAVNGVLISGIYNVADDGQYSQCEIAAAVGQLDGVKAEIPIPGTAVEPLLTLMSRFPGAEEMRANVSKLFHGLVLSTSRIEACGFTATRSLKDLLLNPHQHARA